MGYLCEEFDATRGAFKSLMAKEIHEVGHKSNSFIDEIEFDL